MCGIAVHLCGCPSRDLPCVGSLRSSYFSECRAFIVHWKPSSFAHGKDGLSGLSAALLAPHCRCSTLALLSRGVSLNSTDYRSPGILCSWGPLNAHVGGGSTANESLWGDNFLLLHLHVPSDLRQQNTSSKTLVRTPGRDSSSVPEQEALPRGRHAEAQVVCPGGWLCPDWTEGGPRRS